MSYIQTYLGGKLDLLEPHVDDVQIEEIAHALSLQCRFNGHCKTFYSVAEHSVRVSWHVPQQDRLWGLLHDAAEAYIGDAVRPLKAELPRFRSIEYDIMVVVAAHFGLDWPMPGSVKAADDRLVVTECRDLMARPPFDWGIDAVPIEQQIEPWAPRSAELRFLRRFTELKWPS